MTEQIQKAVEEWLEGVFLDHDNPIALSRDDLLREVPELVENLMKVIQT